MCVPSVTKHYTEGNPSETLSDADAIPASGKPIEGWSNAAGPAARKRAARAARAAAASASVRLASLRGFLQHSNILDRALFKSPAFDRRTEQRHASIVLTEAERVTLRHLARQAANCGTVWMKFAGHDTSGPADKETRLVCKARCGTRACAGCASDIREREAFRVEGPWSLFFTFTVPRERCSTADAWREVHIWIETMTREMRREVAWSNDERPRAPGRRHEAHIDRWIEASGNIACAEKLEYAWVVEPHQDGYPHVHMVVNASWVRFDFIRDLWARSCGALSAWVYGERVYQIDGACRYLCKYIAKATLTIEILAVMYGRRLWATSIKRPEKPEPLWFRILGKEADSSGDEADEPEAFAERNGWKLLSSKRGAYAMWERALPVRSGIRIASTQYCEKYDYDKAKTRPVNDRETIGIAHWIKAAEVYLSDKLKT